VVESQVCFSFLARDKHTGHSNACFVSLRYSYRFETPRHVRGLVLLASPASSVLSVSPPPFPAGPLFSYTAQMLEADIVQVELLMVRTIATLCAQRSLRILLIVRASFTCIQMRICAESDGHARFETFYQRVYRYRRLDRCFKGGFRVHHYFVSFPDVALIADLDIAVDCWLPL
jgi:hypothetical protein